MAQPQAHQQQEADEFPQLTNECLTAIQNATQHFLARMQVLQGPGAANQARRATILSTFENRIDLFNNAIVNALAAIELVNGVNNNGEENANGFIAQQFPVNNPNPIAVANHEGGRRNRKAVRKSRRNTRKARR